MADDSVLQALRDMIAEREWSQFHTPENLAKSVAIEAAELLECYQWGAARDPREVQDELADVLTYCLMLADRLGFDPDSIVLEKLEKTKAKYPVDLAKGRMAKHDRL